MVEKVIPQSLNYADLKPEAIENEIKLVKFTPTATVSQAQQNDVIKFIMQGNGFLDPYSTYIKLTVRCPGLDPNEIRFLDSSAHSFINRLVIRSQGVELERIEQYDILAKIINDVTYSGEQKSLHHTEGFPQQIIDYEHRTRNISGGRAVAKFSQLITAASSGSRKIVGEPAFFTGKAVVGALPAATAVVNEHAGVSLGQYAAWSHYVNGVKANTIQNVVAGQDIVIAESNLHTFIIPIYSGILGVLMPDKKLLPLSLMPLDVEFTLNPHALYSNCAQAANGSRSYIVDKFEIFSHMMFFEQEVHRSLEAVVAENGIFIHFNSFYLAPITAIDGAGLPGYAQINVHFKSINSVHFVFLYGAYNAQPHRRKLSFNSHNLERLQIRNGTFLIPSEPLAGEGLNGNCGTSLGNKHAQFLVETYKAWNKMHDPLSDSALNSDNYCIDNSILGVDGNGRTLDWTFAAPAFEVDGSQASNMADALVMLQSSGVGCCQYGISLEGEELGSDQTIITGRKAMLPFDINLAGTKSVADLSYMFTFVRADFVIYVRPDLVVQLLGR